MAQAVTRAQQGHRYWCVGAQVLAMASGEVVEVREILQGWLGVPMIMEARFLVAEPMRYFNGEVPT